MAKRIINPETGKAIIVGGPTYNDLVVRGIDLSNAMETTPVKRPIREKLGAADELINQMLEMGMYIPKDLEEEVRLVKAPWQQRQLKKILANKEKGQGSPTRGWSLRAPQKGKERHTLMEKCGEKCFLREGEAFPICPSCDSYEGECQCQIDCSGLQSAYNRAREWKYTDVADLADQLLREKCGKQ